MRIDNMSKHRSPKQTNVHKKIFKELKQGTLSHKIATVLLEDKEVQYIQEYANSVSIKRLNYNDHGPVHMRKVMLNSILLLDLLHGAGIKTTLEAEGIGTYQDSKVAVMMASCLHDIGMSVGRSNHEQLSAVLGMPIIQRLLDDLYGNDLEKMVVMRSLIIEGIVGHMGNQETLSLEAGIILVSDGCDMELGRARIPMMMHTESKVGDIHKYSSSAISKVTISKGEKRPIRIHVYMKESVGFFQVGEVLLSRIFASSIEPYIELVAGVKGEKEKIYL